MDQAIYSILIVKDIVILTKISQMNAYNKFGDHLDAPLLSLVWLGIFLGGNVKQKQQLLLIWDFGLLYLTMDIEGLVTDADFDIEFDLNDR